jgi:leucyl aminopeptidase (aminopeptidase T)
VTTRIAAESHNQETGATAEAAWRPDWDALAHVIVNRTLRLQPRERVVYLADPYLYPDFLDAVREAVLKAGGVEQATILNWTPRLERVRGPSGGNPDPEAATREGYAHLDLLNTADVFIWLPNDFRRPSFTAAETEWILGRWRGRGVHFHWFTFMDPTDDPAGTAQLEQVYQRAILDLDYEALQRRQQSLVNMIRGKRLHVTTPEGTDLSFVLPEDGWYHCNNGDASREKSLGAVCARDREEELPCGGVRTIPAESSANGIISLRKPPAWNGHGLDVSQFGTHLDVVFRDGRIVELRGDDPQAAFDPADAGLAGDWDRLGEVVFGTNPLLVTPQGALMPAYWGFGDGVFRFSLGDNIESGGRYASNMLINLFITNATVEADGEVILRDGKLLVE